MEKFNSSPAERLAKANKDMVSEEMTPERINDYRDEEVEAIAKGEAMPTAFGMEFTEIQEAFNTQLDNMTLEELKSFNEDLQRANELVRHELADITKWTQPDKKAELLTKLGIGLGSIGAITVLKALVPAAAGYEQNINEFMTHFAGGMASILLGLQMYCTNIMRINEVSTENIVDNMSDGTEDRYRELLQSLKHIRSLSENCNQVLSL